MKIFARKVGGSYQADGYIVAQFTTTEGKPRVVFEFKDIPGMLHIFSPEQVEVHVGPPLGTVPFTPA